MTKQYMKERSGKDSNVEFQSGTTKKSTPIAKPKPRPKNVGKQYSNPPRKVVFFDPERDRQGKNLPPTSFTGKVYNPEPKFKRPKKNLPLSGKQKRKLNHLLNLSLHQEEKVDQMHCTECHN